MYTAADCSAAPHIHSGDVYRGRVGGDGGVGAADEATEADAIYSRLHADAAQWMAGLRGTPLLERNRAAFDRTLRARAAAAASAQAAAEARLSQTKRIERASTFLPPPQPSGVGGSRCASSFRSALLVFVTHSAAALRYRVPPAVLPVAGACVLRAARRAPPLRH